jgi:hypothetical protein
MNIRRLALCVIALIICVVCVLVLIPRRPKYLGQAKTEALINGKNVSIIYGQPSLDGPALRGRDPLSIAPVGFVWRFGRNEATLLESAGRMGVGGKDLPAGRYTLWARRLGEDQWVISFHTKTQEWYGRPLWGDVMGGAARLQNGFIADMPLTTEKVSERAELLNIKLSEDQGTAVVTIHFGNIVQRGTFTVN